MLRFPFFREWSSEFVPLLHKNRILLSQKRTNTGSAARSFGWDLRICCCESCCLFVLRGFMLASFKGWLALRLAASFLQTTICESRRINSTVNFYNMGWHKEFQSSVLEQLLLWQNQTSLISRSISWTIAPAAVIMLRHQRTSPLPWFALPESRKVELLTHAKELSLEKSTQRQLNDFWFGGGPEVDLHIFRIPTFLWFNNLYVALLYHAS